MNKNGGRQIINFHGIYMTPPTLQPVSLPNHPIEAVVPPVHMMPVVRTEVVAGQLVLHAVH